MATNKKVKVYESLRLRIINGELQPGLPINEADFARELSVSKVPSSSRKVTMTAKAPSRRRS